MTANYSAEKSWSPTDDMYVFKFLFEKNESGRIAKADFIVYRSDFPKTTLYMGSVPAYGKVSFQLPTGDMNRPYGMLEFVDIENQPNGDNAGIMADFHYGFNNRRHFEGIMITFNKHWSGKRRDYVSTPEMDSYISGNEDQDVLPTGSALREMGDEQMRIKEEKDFFPYLYLHSWGSLPEEDMRRYFVDYKKPQTSPPTENLFDKLAQVKSFSAPDAREQMTALARDFVSGTGDFPGMGLAQKPITVDIGRLERVFHQLKGKTTEDLDQLGVDAASSGAVTWRDIGKDLASPEFAVETDRLWQNLFALSVLLHHRDGTLEQLNRILVVIRLIERIAVKDPILATSGGVYDALNATIVLPPEIFPLPPSSDGNFSSPPRIGNEGWVLPYAIGELQMVRQNLLRYEPGEIAHIENVMKGECKKTVRRKRSVTKELIDQKRGNNEELGNEVTGNRTDLFKETQRTIDKVETNYGNLKTSYGPLTTATLDGSWSVQGVQNGAKPSREDYAKFAKEVINKTVNRIVRFVSESRVFSTYDESEEIVTHTYDNTSGTLNIRGVYRWVNKVYSTYVVNYGSRLMFEFMVKEPASTYIQSERAFTGESMRKIIPPVKLGITNYNDITVDNFAFLATRYEVRDLTTPPVSSRTVSLSFQGDEAVCTREAAVPDGYRASKAYVTYNLKEDGGGAKLVGLVGRNSFSFEFPQSGMEEFPMNGEDISVPVALSVAGNKMNLSPPTTEPDSFFVTIEIECVPTEATISDWKIKIYNSLMAGYRALSEKYYETTGSNDCEDETLNPLGVRDIEKEQLKDCCLRQLLNKRYELVGNGNTEVLGDDLKREIVNEPRFIQFFEEAFEWNEIAYSFYADLISRNDAQRSDRTDLKSFGGGDSLFTKFLQAGFARVVVPVRPSHVMKVLYYIASGTVWSGSDSLTPVHEEHLPIANGLKQVAGRVKEKAERSETWEVTVPTAMHVLQESNSLPHCREEEKPELLTQSRDE